MTIYQHRDVRDDINVSVTTDRETCEIEFEDCDRELVIVCTDDRWIVSWGSNTEVGSFQDGGLFRALERAVSEKLYKVRDSEHAFIGGGSVRVI